MNYRSRYFVGILLAILCGFFSDVTINAAIPDSWKAEWSNPSAAMRPLQIIHGGVVNYDTPEKMAYFKDQCGLGGIVCNVGSSDYLYNDAEWKRFVDAVKSARQIGLRVWIYDEDGYPSPEAGGVVLKGHPELESLALTFDVQKENDPFFIRPAYEFTHASNNFAAARRYPNPLNPDSTKRFLDVTHRQYRDRLGKELFEQIEAFFTDEPSINAVNIGELPESVKSQVRVDDPLDPAVKPLPMVPWCNDLPARYKEEYGDDLIPLRKSLFTGDTDKDKAVRQKFWTLIGKLDARRYYGAIQNWCQENGSSIPTVGDPDKPLRLASSGHTLHEEPTVAHVPLDGNKLQVLWNMDVPGMDMLNSDPRAVFWGAWRAAAYPCSAAFWTGRRLVMTESSDFSQQMEKKGEVDLDTMFAACSWQAAWGVTEFTLYYGIKGRGEDVHKQYCERIGRLNAVLRRAEPVRTVILYYPISELQAEYIPQADPIDVKKQSKKTQELVADFEQTGQLLMQSQIPFVLSDTTTFSTRIPCTVVSKPVDVEKVRAMPRPKIEPANPWIVLGHFQREGHEIIQLLNTDPEKTYEGVFSIPARDTDQNGSVLNPATGEITEIPVKRNGAEDTLSIQLQPKQTLLLVL